MNQDKINLLKVAYDSVRVLNSNYLLCKRGDYQTVVNENAVEVISSNTGLSIQGSFIYTYDENSVMHVINIDTNRETYIDMKDHKLHVLPYKIEALSSILAIESSKFTLLYDKWLRLIKKLDNIYGVKFIGDYAHGHWFKYYITGDYRVYKGFIDNRTYKISVLDSYELTNRNDLIAVDVHSYDGVAMNSKSNSKFRYKLSDKNKVISEKDYEDITKPFVLKSENILMTHDLVDGKHTYGLITETGRELITASMHDIKYIGQHNFILTYNNEYALYNTENGMVYNFKEISNVIINEALPFVLIQVGNEFKIVDGYGRIFNCLELAKYFKCSYSKQNPQIIQIELDFGNKYITNQFTPITNVHEIAKLKQHEWIQM